jgi:hypothetical protein
MKIFLLAVLPMLFTSACSTSNHPSGRLVKGTPDALPREFLNKSSRLLDSSVGCKYEVLLTVKSPDATFYLIEQQPTLGDWSYALIKKRSNHPARLIIAGGITDILNTPIPASISKSIARAYADNEFAVVLGPRGLNAPDKYKQLFMERIRSEWGDIPQSLQQEFRRLGVAP